MWPQDHSTYLSSRFIEQSLNLHYRDASTLLSFWEKKYILKSIALGAGEFEYKWLANGIPVAKKLKQKALRNVWLLLLLFGVAVLCFALGTNFIHA